MGQFPIDSERRLLALNPRALTKRKMGLEEYCYIRVVNMHLWQKIYDNRKVGKFFLLIIV